MKPCSPSTPKPRPNRAIATRAASGRAEQRGTQSTGNASKNRASFSALLAKSGLPSADASNSSPMSGSLDEPRDEHAPVEPYGDTADPTLAWVLLQHVQPDAGTPTIPSLSSPSSAVDITENNFGAMFEQFVSSVRIGKQGDLACVSLTLDLGGTAPVHVMIEETSMGPTIELQSDNPAEAFALEQALKTKQGSKHPR